MIFRRSARDDRAALDRLLDTAPIAASGPEAEPLARLLSAAAAPGRPDELAGEEAAVAAFRAARATPTRRPKPTRRHRPSSAGVVAWGAGIAVTATAGVAFAAVAIDRPDDPVPPRPATPAPTIGVSERGETAGPGRTPDRGTTTRAPSATESSRPAVPTTGAPATPAASPSPRGRGDGLPGLCRAYLAKSPAQREKALDTPAFTDLVTAAGDREQVVAYCTELVGEVRPARTRGPEAAPSATP